MLSVRVHSEDTNSPDTAASVHSFLGRWDLTLKTSVREYPLWSEITRENTGWDHPDDSRFSEYNDYAGVEVIWVVSPDLR